ncbi:MAG: Rieske (2Fe-2S) protein [Anaerolineales bacterium]|nr:Rieske (2Fe-2S) protein [Anaerolineales bacterium]
MSWVKALNADDLKPGERRLVTVGGRSVLLLHHLEQIFAVEGNCPHMGLPLRWGELTDDCGLICPWHHSAFDLRTGDVKAWSPWPPGLGTLLGSLTRRRALRVFPAKREAGAVWVDLDAA